MEGASMFKMPTIDLSAKSLLMLSQLGIFMVFAYWSIEDGAGDNLDYVFFAMMSAAGLALFFSVPNARMGVTLGIPAVMVVMGLATGEYGIMFWAVFMLLMIGPIAYMPALASGDSTLDLDDESRKMRLGILWIVFALFMMAMMSELLVMAVDGEVTEEDEDGNDVFTMTLDSTQQTIAQIGLAIGVIGVLVFLLTALVGMELGPMLPWHGGAMAAGAMLISQYLWSVGEGAPSMVAGDIAFILCIIGLTILPPCIAYRSE